MLTAVYDLSVSPLTFDFSYAAVQAEVERRRRGHDRLLFHVRRDEDWISSAAYVPGEADWRLRHILAPLSQMLPVPAALKVDARPPAGGDVFTRRFGMHWLSDVAVLAQAGEDVQVLSARPEAKQALDAELRSRVNGRRIITITLRETRYGLARNSDLEAWAALARCLPRDRYAVVVLRDHERVSEPLPGNWGEVIPLPAAVWSLHTRMALYELAWLNLAVNNGPLGLLVFNPRTRFQIFKMIGGTWETTPQHFRRLGIAPGMNFPFLKPHQEIVWEDDDIEVLTRRVSAKLEMLDGQADDPPGKSGDAIECLIEAARRDFRTGRPAADILGRLPGGSRRADVALEWANMLVAETRLSEAAFAVRDAPASEKRDELTRIIAHATAITDRSDQAEIDEPSAWTCLKTPIPVGTSRLDATLIRLGAIEGVSRRGATPPPHLFLRGDVSVAPSAIALFPSLTGYECEPDATIDAGEDGAATELTSLTRGTAVVPARASRLLDQWSGAQGSGDGSYGVVAFARKTPERSVRQSVAFARRLGLKVVRWNTIAKTWPIEMLAALLVKASVRIVDEPTALALAHVLDLPCMALVETGDGKDRAAAALDVHRCAERAGPLGPALALHARVVCLAPDVPAFRDSFAEAISRLDPQAFTDRSNFRLLRRSSVLFALRRTIAAGGRSATLAEPFASGVVLADPAIRRAMDRVNASTASFETAITARVLHRGTAASLLAILLPAVMVREPRLLQMLDRLAAAFVDHVIENPAYVPPRKVSEFFGRIAHQIWIHDGPLMSLPDPDRSADIDGSPRTDDAFMIVRRLMRQAAPRRDS